MSVRHIGGFSVDGTTDRMVRYYLVGNRISKFSIRAVGAPEPYTTEPIFTSRTEAVRFAHKMLRNQVTPCALEGVLHDYLYEKVFLR